MTDKLTEDAFDLLFEKLIRGAGDGELQALTAAIQGLDYKTRYTIEAAAIAYAARQAEAAFIAGLRCGRDPLLLVLEPSAKRHQPGGRGQRA